MRTSTFFLSILLSITLVFTVQVLSAQQSFRPRYLKSNDRALLDKVYEANNNGWLFFKNDARVKASSFLNTFGSSVGLSEGYELKKLKDETDFKEIRHETYQLYYRGIVVEGYQYLLHSRNDVLEVAHGRIVEGISLEVNGRRITENQARELALKAQGFDLADAKADYNTRMVIANIGSEDIAENFKLCYRFDVIPRELFLQKDNKEEKPVRVYVDAMEGKVVKTLSLINTDRPKLGSYRESAKKGYHPPVNRFSPLVTSTFIPFYNRYLQGAAFLTFETEPVAGGFRLSDRNGALQTRIDVNLNREFDDPDVVNPTTNWGTNFQVATTAHWLMQRNLLFLQQFAPDQNGIDYQHPGQVIPRVLVDANLPNNAGWYFDGKFVAFGVFTNPFGNEPVLTADIFGHEVTHGLNDFLITDDLGFAVGLDYSREPGALDESVSDIFGTAFERFLFPNDWNWQIGEDSQTFRNMASPEDYGQPSVYQQGFWHNINVPDNDDFGVHTNSGVMNKWFHTLCTGQGPNNTSVEPISFNDAIKIVYRAVRDYFTPVTQYVDARDATITAARQLFGGCSPQEKAVIAAWNAGGLPSPNRCDPACDFQPSLVVSNSQTGCNQQITLTGNCSSPNQQGCFYVSYTFTGPNVPANGNGTSLTITTPSTAGYYEYKVKAVKTNCYQPTATYNVGVYCAGPPSGGGSSYNQCIESENAPGTGNITQDPNASNGSTRGEQNQPSYYVDYGFVSVPVAGTYTARLRYYGVGTATVTVNGGNGFQVSFPDTYAWNIAWGEHTFPITLPAGSATVRIAGGGATAIRQDKLCIYNSSGGGTTPDPCDLSSGPVNVGTWNGYIVQIRQFAGGKRALVTTQAGSSNDKHFPRGDNFWDNFTKNPGVESLQACLNAGETGWYGLAFPSGITPPSGYLQGSEPDGAIFFSTNGLRVLAGGEAVSVELEKDVALVNVFPNPASGHVTVEYRLKGAGKVKISLIDLQGKVLSEQQIKGVSGLNSRSLRLTGLAAGSYGVVVEIEGQRIIRKLIKE